MFGYVVVNQPEMKFKDFDVYKSFYCGLCRELKEKYGITGQISLTYDMTFVILLLSGLYEPKTKKGTTRCILHPVCKQTVRKNEITEYAADMNLILAYYHLQDDWEDEKKIGSFAGGCALRRRVKKAIGRYPRQSRVIQKELKNLAVYEKTGTTEVDLPAGCFGRLMEELFVYKKDCWEPYLRGMGFYLGKYIYLMDAYEDLEKDIRENSYNPLKKMAEEADYEDHCREILCMMMGECTAYFERLPCVLDVDILRNILYDGVWKRYRRLQEKKSEEEKHDKKSI